MSTQFAVSVIAICLPWVSGQTRWFVIWCFCGLLLILGSAGYCTEVTDGLAGIGCIIIAFAAVLLLAAGIAAGVVRLISSGGGQRATEWRKVLLAGIISYSLAVIAMVVAFTFPM